MATTTAPVTFQSLARDHGKALAFIAKGDDNPVPADPTSVDPDGLIKLVTDAEAFYTSARHFEEAETLESAGRFLVEARDAQDADRPTLLKLAARELNDISDMASELADELGEEFED